MSNHPTKWARDIIYTLSVAWVSTDLANKITDNRIAKMLLIGLGLGISHIIKNEAEKNEEKDEPKKKERKDSVSPINYHSNHGQRIKSEMNAKEIMLK